MAFNSFGRMHKTELSVTYLQMLSHTSVYLHKPLLTFILSSFTLKMLLHRSDSKFMCLKKH